MHWLNGQQCVPSRQFRGLGSLENLRYMNVTLLSKWWRQLKFNYRLSLWRTILLLKYHFNFQDRISPFWSLILHIISNMRINMKCLVGMRLMCYSSIMFGLE
jgi:hypothetical protein